MLKIGALYKCKIHATQISADFIIPTDSRIEVTNISLKDTVLLYLGEQQTKDCWGTVGYQFLIDGQIGYFPFRTFRPKALLEEVHAEE